MIFKRLLGRKKKHTPVVENQDDLIRIACDDPDAQRRLDACGRIRRLPALRERAASDPDAGVRDAAVARYCRLLCEANGDDPDLSERLAEIAAQEDQQVLEQVALGAQAPELRATAIAKVASADVLARCALDDTRAVNRNAAVERLDDKEALAQVAKSIGKKDKQVYRVTRRKLKEIADREALPERIRLQCEELLEKLERLGRFGHWVQDHALLDLLDRQWAQIEPDADQDRTDRYRTLRERFLTAYEAYRSEHAAQIAAEEVREVVRGQRNALLDDMQSLSSLSDRDKLSLELERIAARWEELDALPEREQAALDDAYATTRAQLTAQREELAALERRNRRLHQLLALTEQALEPPKPLASKHVRDLLEEAKSLVAAKGADQSLVTRMAVAHEEIDKRLRKQKQQAKQRLELLPERLAALADAIEGGVLKEAEPLYQSIVAGIELIELSDLPRQSYASAATQLRELAPRVRDLQKWRKWGADQHRVELCIAMEELVTQDMRLEALTLRLQDLQSEWKGLDKGGSPANQRLWERFHAASERVYARCKPYLDEQAAERETNRQQREQLCAGLEAFLDQVDWEWVDWKKATRAESEMRRAWSAMGPVEGRHHKALEKRFRTAMKRLGGHLATERERNQAHKRALIAGVEALAEEPDLGHAIEETKRLQRQWNTTVAARQKEENRLWQRFRAACDAVFARRREQHEAHAAELTENLRGREGLCAEAEQLAASDAGSDALDAALRELDKRWRSSEVLSVPRQALPALEDRWRRARNQVERRRGALLEEQHRRDLELLARQAAVCERLERSLETDVGTHEEPTAIAAAWQTLPKQRDAHLQAAIEQRFEHALSALKQGGQALQHLRDAFVTDGARRAEVCLHLEILAQVDSPPQFTKQRLQFQVTRLTEHMREGERDPLGATSRLICEWYLCGSAPAAEAPALEERFQHARAAIDASKREGNAA